MRKISCLAAPAVVAVLVLASCGDDDGADVRESGSASGSASGSESGSASGTAGGEPPVSLEGTVNDHGTAEVDVDGEASVTVTLPDEGAVEFHCRFHEPQGMKGAFYFNEGDQVDTGS